MIVPEESGVLSALGFIASVIKNEFSQTFVRSIASDDTGRVREPFESLTARAREWLDEENVDVADQDVRFILDMRYARQGLRDPDRARRRRARLARPRGARARASAKRTSALYGFVLEGGAEIVNLRVAQPAAFPARGRDAAGRRATRRPRRRGTQSVWTPEGTIDVPTYERAALEPGMAIDGYAIVEQYDATTVVLPGHRAVVDPWMNLLIWPEEESR